ncbi:aldose 1-epimerase family protein [Enterococcus mundtii]|uniref:aldose 1-epimerase family protein n=1 Tax=Enterococcus TaxID=1350 RepID=UPI00044D04C3|nr:MULTISPECIES: aldose 1-epimerase family protein [Enterococcus]AZP92595.1 aldose 1-epimerase family protein [Enterococcus mundtii]EYT96233.1 aldose 1-epimerase [Enterococcus mundtii CRL35]MDA9429503.1 LacX protein, plasmid [Enterococcus mundtii 1A]MDK4211637.1 aldose 1-epimerase family protein [Enterococcus mundtii]MEC3941215.1 aldose 1-epimerase family protein [Enterococcus mundtii]
MTVIIQNDQLIAEISEHGAELISLKSKEHDLEYIWQGDPKYWGRHAPVLFPIVGRLKNDQYVYQGKTYSMGQHGFARDMDFEVAEHEQERAKFVLKSTPETKENYPFDFELVLVYELGGDGITVHYHVENIGEEEMYFSIGGHPAFNVPLEEGLTFEDFYLAFSPRKSRLRLPLAGPFIDMEQKTIGQTNTNLALFRELFDQDALVFETRGLNAYSIRSEKSSHSVTLSYKDMPYVGIWSPYPKEAPFVCIEPWFGIADTVDSNGQLNEKAGINQLGAHELFKTKYSITVK